MIQSLTQWTADMNIPCMVEAMLIMSWESQVVRAWVNENMNINRFLPKGGVDFFRKIYHPVNRLRSFQSS